MRQDTLEALRDAGREIARSTLHGAGREGLKALRTSHTMLPGDVEHLDQVAREHGLDWMPENARRAWEAVYEGVDQESTRLIEEGVDPIEVELEVT